MKIQGYFPIISTYLINIVKKKSKTVKTEQMNLQQFQFLKTLKSQWEVCLLWTLFKPVYLKCQDSDGDYVHMIS